MRRVRGRVPPSTAELMRHLIDQHGLTRAAMSRSSEHRAALAEVPPGKKELSIAMLQRTIQSFSGSRGTTRTSSINAA
jgi:antitoxin component HigA of HigAB toxin-antitoxin module